MLELIFRSMIILVLFSSLVFFGCAEDDTTAPTVTSFFPADSASDIAVNTGISVEFSESMDTSTVGANVDNTVCSGSIQVSANGFSSCVQMSDEPVASNSDKTFTFTPASNLSGLTTYKIKVTTSIEDKSGNALTNTYTTASGFTTALGALTGNWIFVDGNGENGINFDFSEDAEAPQIIAFNDELYATWHEVSTIAGSNDQIRVAKWNGSSIWNFVDGGAGTGINKDASQDAGFPQLAEFNSKLYALWHETYGVNPQIRVAEFDELSGWNFVDGGGTTGINFNTGCTAIYGRLAVYNSELYAIWQERDTGGTFQIRVAKWDGTSSWDFVDGNNTYGINKNPSQPALAPQLVEFNSNLYAVWHEFNGSDYQIRVTEWDGNTSWSFVDGGGSIGLNFSATQDAEYPQVQVFNSNLFIIWEESTISYHQIRVKKWDGSVWEFVDGNTTNGINRLPSQNGYRPTLSLYNNRLFASWNEYYNTVSQIRIAEWDGTSIWSSVDGDGSNGINKNVSAEAVQASLIEYNYRPYAVWREANGSFWQIRVAVGETQ